MLCLLAALALASMPAGALAAGLGGNGLNELTEGSPETETTNTATASTSTETSTKNSSTVITVAIAAGVVLLMAVAFVIVRDARRVAPATDSGELVQGSSPRHSEAALRKRRAKAKEARRQRKRNR